MSSGRNCVSIIFARSISPLIAPTLRCTSMIRFMPSRWIWPFPQYGMPCVVARRQVAHRCARHLGRDVEVLGDDVAGFVRILDHELDGAAARANDAANEIAARLLGFTGRHAHDVVERRQRFGAGDQHAILVLHLGPQRLGDGGDVDLAEVERGEHRAESAGLDQLGVLLLVAGLPQQQDRERLAGRARIRVADLLALQILDRLDRRVLLHHPGELGDR